VCPLLIRIFIDLEQTELEDLLDEALQVDFNVQAEDDSPYQVARSLINMHNQVAGGDASYVHSLQQVQPLAAGASQHVPRPIVPGEDAESSSSDDGGDDVENDAGGDGDVEVMDMQVDEQMNFQGPVVDEDGFQVVQRRGRGGRR
jgi:pre-rRNA-processing protein TSR2